MKSIDRLRKYGARFNNSHDAWSGIGTEILEFADEIEHDVDDMWHAMTIDAKPMTDENMAKSGWVRLPVDADGVPIHIGDWITGDWDAKAKVVAITSEDVYWWEPDGCHWCHAYEVRHHYAPTVEDVLREFASDIADVLGGDDFRLDDSDELFAEYAAKLRLGGEE